MDGMRLRLIGEIEELGHGARIELIAPLGPRRGGGMRVLASAVVAFPEYLPFFVNCYTGVQPGVCTLV